MKKNEFFFKKGPFALDELIKSIDTVKVFDGDNGGSEKIHGVESLDKATSSNITFLNSSRYKEYSLKTKALACITSSNLSTFLPKKCKKIIVKNVLLEMNKIMKQFYPNADIDYPDSNLVNSKDLKKLYADVFFGTNVLIGKNVKIGKNTFIGNNTIIESNVNIGDNCNIGSFVLIRNSLIKNFVHIKDGSKIGIKGFGFIPIKNKNFRSPQIGKVILEEGVEIGANCTIDRGSVSDTVIGRNTFLDNLIHIAHNVKIGENCMFAAQVGVAGSTNIGNNVVVGGQGGISGHLKIGDNVQVVGGSAVLNDVLKGQVGGVPAVPLREFVKLRRKK
tara:strand:+ start:3951 stop:4949 length:999 start_codon:yes stop_codon:yes gene_type:complete